MSDGQLKSIMQRIIALHEAEDEIKADRRDIYAEAKSAGYDKTALGVAVRTIRNREKNETPEAQERAAIVDIYLAEYDRPHVRAHMHEANEAAGFNSRSLAEDRCDDGSNPSAAADIGAVADPRGVGRPDGGERPAPSTIAKPIDLTIPAFLDRRPAKPDARQ